MRIGGPVSSRHSAFLLPDRGEPPESYDAVCARLHNSGLRTVVLGSIDDLTPAAAAPLLDELSLPWVTLVGYRAGAELAWRTAAANSGRFVSLVAIDRPHPAALAAGHTDADRRTDPDCRPVEMPTTLIVGSGAGAAATRTGRYVYAEFRLVRLNGRTDLLRTASHELATEIVLRSSAW